MTIILGPTIINFPYKVDVNIYSFHFPLPLHLGEECLQEAE